jgi:hypothetical protein
VRKILGIRRHPFVADSLLALALALLAVVTALALVVPVAGAPVAPPTGVIIV